MVAAMVVVAVTTKTTKTKNDEDKDEDNKDSGGGTECLPVDIPRRKLERRINHVEDYI